MHVLIERWRNEAAKRCSNTLLSKFHNHATTFGNTDTILQNVGKLNMMTVKIMFFWWLYESQWLGISFTC